MKAGVQSTHIFCRGDLFSYSVMQLVNLNNIQFKR